MFSNELKWHFNADAMYSTIEVEIPDNFAIAPGTPFYMENGECEVELEDGSTDFMFCTEEDDYTGIVIAKVIGGEAVFVKYVIEYEFEQVEFLMFDNVCDLTQAANVYNANAATSEVIVNSVTTMTETNTNGMDAAEKELAEKAEMSSRYLKEIENGGRVPSFHKIRKLVRALNVPPEPLFYPNNHTDNLDYQRLLMYLSKCNDEQITAILAIVEAYLRTYKIPTDHDKQDP